MAANALTGRKKGEAMKPIRAEYAFINALDQFCDNFPVRIIVKISSGSLDDCKVKVVNLGFRSLLCSPSSLQRCNQLIHTQTLPQIDYQRIFLLRKSLYVLTECIALSEA